MHAASLHGQAWANGVREASGKGAQALAVQAIHENRSVTGCEAARRALDCIQNGLYQKHALAARAAREVRGV